MRPRRREAPPPLLVVMQVLTTSWTKRSRGGANAERRNAVPQALPLPRMERPLSPAYVVHSVGFYEYEDFQPSEKQAPRVLALTAPLAFSNLVLLPNAEERTVKVTVDGKVEEPVGGGRDDAEPSLLPGNAGGGRTSAGRFVLAEGEWGQVAYNRRFSYEDGWAYRKWVFNIAVARALQADLFTVGPPTALVARMNRLR